MFINNQQAIQTLNKLSSTHKKVVDDFYKKDITARFSAEELNQVRASLHALDAYSYYKNYY